MCSHGSSDVVEYLATKHPELINIVDENNDNGLHLASWRGNLETVMYLIETLKMDPVVKGNSGRNSFLHACYYEKLKIVKYLGTKHSDPGTVQCVNHAKGRGVNQFATGFLSQTQNSGKIKRGEGGSMENLSQIALKLKNLIIFAGIWQYTVG